MLGPIFAREWLTLPRRVRHYLTRVAYLGLLWVLGLTAWQASVGWEQAATLGDTARFGALLFQILIYVQLILGLFFAALSAASTIAQEKDRRTFVLLLITDLRNYEIVLGKLCGSLLQMALLLAGTIPILALAMLLGGVAQDQIIKAALILATTTLAAGSLGGLMANWREKTFPALALTVLLLVLYVALVYMLGLVPLVFAGIDAEAVFGVQTWLEPFLALYTVLDPELEARGIAPAYGYALVMLGVSVLLNGFGIWKLRVWNPSGEPIIQRERPEEEMIDRAKAHAAPGAVRPVWKNPILWREMVTRAYGRRPLLVKFAYVVVVCLLGYYAFAPTGAARDWVAARVLVPISILSLLLVSAQAVTAITSERDLGALDLLLVTDLTPQEFIFGKLLGILYNTKEFLIPPILFAGVYALRGLLASPPAGHPEMLAGKNIEAFICIGIGAALLLAFTMILGIHVALRTESSRLAIIHTLGTVFFLSVGTIVCMYLIWINRRFEYQWLSFSAFIFAGVGGLWWVLSGDRPSAALTLASWACPFAVFYSITNILIGKPGGESTDPVIPFIVIGSSFGFTIAAMLVPLLSEFDVALGRTTGGGE